MTYPLSPEAVAQMVADRENAMSVQDELETLYAMASVQDGYAKKTTDRGLRIIHKANAKAQREVAATVTTLAAENATLRQHNDIRGQNMRDTWEAMQAMRDAINDHIPLPSTESDLLQGPENSVFCEVVATAVIGALATLRASEAAALERVKVLTEALAKAQYGLSWAKANLRDFNVQGAPVNDGLIATGRALTPTADKEPTT